MHLASQRAQHIHSDGGEEGGESGGEEEQEARARHRVVKSNTHIRHHHTMTQTLHITTNTE